MKWHDYRMQWKEFARETHLRGDIEACAPVIYEQFRVVENERELTNTRLIIESERKWTTGGRPYYDLYPSVTEAFTKIDLGDLKGEHVRLPLDELLIRLADGADENIECLFVFNATDQTSGGRDLRIVIQDRALLSKKFHLYYPHSLLMASDETLDEAMKDGALRVSGVVNIPVMVRAMKIVSTLCLLRDNPDLIEPLALECDREKYERTGDPALIDKVLNHLTHYAD